jgi:hypothetical protein
MGVVGKYADGRRKIAEKSKSRIRLSESTGPTGGRSKNQSTFSRKCTDFSAGGRASGCFYGGIKSPDFSIANPA